MARGWESKSIESQQDEARANRARRNAPDAAQDPRRRTLELARARVAADLERATLPAHRDMLQRALVDLDNQLASLP